MSVTIMEALQNAQYNLVAGGHNPLQLHIGKEQLNNAVILLEKGYKLSDLVDPLIEPHGNVNNVPDAPA